MIDSSNRHIVRQKEIPNTKGSLTNYYFTFMNSLISMAQDSKEFSTFLKSERISNLQYSLNLIKKIVQQNSYYFQAWEMWLISNFTTNFLNK